MTRKNPLSFYVNSHAHAELTSMASRNNITLTKAVEICLYVGVRLDSISDISKEDNRHWVSFRLRPSVYEAVNTVRPDNIPLGTFIRRLVVSSLSPAG
jgi:hypothetical protein